MSTNSPLNFDDLGAKQVSVAPATGSLDFSDLGAKTISPAPPPTAPNAQPHSFTEDVAQGFGAAAGETLINAGKLGSKIPGVSYVAEKIGDVAGLPKLAPGTDPYAVVEQRTAPARAAALSTTAGKIGYGLEGLAEFIAGDEALKGLSYGERLLKTAQIAKFLEKSPRLAKAVEIGMNVLRTGTVGGTQGLAHGESPGEAAATGAVAGGTGAAFELAAEGAKALAPTIKKIAGEAIPVRASQESKLASAAESVSREAPLQRFDVEQTQPAARRAVGNVATDVKNTAAQKIGSDTGDFRQAVKELGNGKSFADLPTGEQSKILARAQELKTARNGLSAASKAADFGEAADQMRAQAKPIYEKLDELTKDQEMTFSDLQRAERSAFNKGDYEAATKAQRAQEKIFDANKDQFSDPDAYTNARKAWRQASALDKIHDTITSKGVMESTPNDLIQRGTSDPRYIKGKQFADTVLYLRDTGLLKDAGLTPQHVQNLQDIAAILRSGGEVQKANHVAKVFKLAKIAVGGPATAGAGWGASAVLGKILTDPKAAALAAKTLQAGAKAAPAAVSQGAR